MSHKDIDDTQNIYTSWLSTLCTLSHEYTRELDEFTPEELNHLNWLIEQEIESRNGQQ